MESKEIISNNKYLRILNNKNKINTVRIGS